MSQQSNIALSICTVSMNRLHHLKETLPKNLKDNEGCAGLEFVLLDYSSTDGLEEWVKANFPSQLASGYLKFHRLEGQEYFDRSHSRNRAFKHANGEILCNVDADNFTGKGFADYVLNAFRREQNIFLTADTKMKSYFLRNAFGRFAVRATDYWAVGGMDEEMKGYGSEILDLHDRLKARGLQERIIGDLSFLNALSHSDEERIQHEFFAQKLYQFYICHHDLEASEALLRFKDGSYQQVVLTPSDNHLPAKVTKLEQGDWKNWEGWKGNDGEMVSEEGHVFNPINDKGFLAQAAKDYPFMVNAFRQESKRALDKRH